MQNNQLQVKKENSLPVFLASATNKVLIHNVAEKQIKSTINEQSKIGQNIWQMSWSHNNTIIATCAESDNRITLSKADDGILCYQSEVCRQGVGITDLCFSSKSTMIAFCCTDSTVGIFNLQDKLVSKQFNDHTPEYSVNSVSFNNNDTQLASGSVDGQVQVRFLNDISQSFQFQESASITQLRFSQMKEKFLAVAQEDGKVSIWDTNLKQKKNNFEVHQSPCTGIAFSPVNLFLLCSCGLDGKIFFFDIVEGKIISAIAFSCDGHTIGFGTLKGKIILCDLKDQKKEKIELKGQEGKKINALQFSRPYKPGQSKVNSSISSVRNSESSKQQPSTNININNKALNEVSNTTTTSNLSQFTQNKINNPVIQLQPKEIQKADLKLLQQQVELKTKQEVEARRIIEQQRVPQTQTRIEQQLKALEDEFSSQSKFQLAYDNNKTNDAQNFRQRLPQLIIPSTTQPLTIKEEKKEEDDEEDQEELLQAINKRRNNIDQLTEDQKFLIEQLFDQRSQDYLDQLQSMFSNMHLELIRNFQLQENQIRQTLQSVSSKNKKKKQELNRLREENKKLKQISY